MERFEKQVVYGECSQGSPAYALEAPCAAQSWLTLRRATLRFRGVRPHPSSWDVLL